MPIKQILPHSMNLRWALACLYRLGDPTYRAERASWVVLAYCKRVSLIGRPGNGLGQSPAHRFWLLFSGIVFHLEVVKRDHRITSEDGYTSRPLDLFSPAVQISARRLALKVSCYSELSFTCIKFVGAKLTDAKNLRRETDNCLRRRQLIKS